jgi:hypothetical protein
MPGEKLARHDGLREQIELGRKLAKLLAATVAGYNDIHRWIEVGHGIGGQGADRHPHKAAICRAVSDQAIHERPASRFLEIVVFKAPESRSRSFGVVFAFWRHLQILPTLNP